MSAECDGARSGIGTGEQSSQQMFAKDEFYPWKRAVIVCLFTSVGKDIWLRAALRGRFCSLQPSTHATKVTIMWAFVSASTWRDQTWVKRAFQTLNKGIFLPTGPPHESPQTASTFFKRRSVMLFHVFFLSCQCVVHAKNLKVKSPKVCWCSSLPQKTLLLKRLVSSPTLNSVTLWHRTVSYICIMHTACSPGRSEAISPLNPLKCLQKLELFP